MFWKGMNKIMWIRKSIILIDYNGVLYIGKKLKQYLFIRALEMILEHLQYIFAFMHYRFIWFIQ